MFDKLLRWLRARLAELFGDTADTADIALSGPM